MADSPRGGLQASNSMTIVTPRVNPPGGPVLGRRYQAVQVLKAAAGVETILAEDTEAGGTVVVVKRAPLSALGSALVARLEHEATVLARLPDGAGPVLLASGVEDGSFWLAQRFLPGQTLQSRLGEGPLGVDEALRMAGEVLAQLSQAHELGVLHRDVKPANILLSPAPGGVAATLIDFGLARSSWLDAGLRDQAVGTARYMSPEQAGLVDRAADQRSDLYSFGVVLFESLAGRPPFEGSEVGTVLRQHLAAAAPDLRAAGVGVPRALAELVDRLLRKDPEERYQSAVAVLTDVEAIAAARRGGVADPHVVIGQADRRTSLTEPVFVGRAGELNDLAALLETAEQGLGGLAVVEGESGSGKTRLLEELARRAAQHGAWVLRGLGVDQGAQRPYQLLDGVAAGVVDIAGVEPELAPRLRARLGVFAQPVVAALPRLASVLPAGPDSALPEEYGETRSVAALAAFLDALGTAERPALVILDDCQWAPRVTAQVIAQWRRRPRSGQRVMLVASFRSEEVAADSALRSMRPDACVTLGPLAPGEVADLIGSMAGQVPGDAVATVHRLSEGSPFMAQAVLRGMVECGALVWTPAGWSLDPLSLDEVQASRRAALFLMRRLELLSHPALRLLDVGATLGKEFDLDLAVRLSGLSPDEASGGLDDALRRRILWVDDTAGRARFLHDKLREAVLARLDRAARRVLHLEAARALQAGWGGTGSDASAFDLAYHFDAAGHADEALPHALAAAEQARAQHALEIAETQYLIAARGATSSQPSTAALVAEGLGDVLALRGRYADAEAHLEAALTLTAEPVRRAALEGKLGDVAFRRGDQGKACQLLEGALRQLGHRVPRRGLARLAALLWAVMVQVAHTLVPSLLGRRSRPPTESETLAMRLHSRLAYAYWFRSGMIACGWTHLRGMNLAERFPASPELAQAYSEHAPVMTMIPWYSRGITYARRSLAIRTDLGDVWGQGQSLHFYGVVLYAASRYRESLACCDEAIRLLARTGDRWEMNTATWHAAFAHYRLGELDQAAAISAQLHADAVEIGDQAAAGIALSSWSRATNGCLPQDVVAAELARSNEDAQTATEVRLAEAIRLLAVGRPAEAVAVLELAHREVRRARLRQEYVAPVLPWLATALRAQFDALPPEAPSQDLRRRRSRTTRAACRLARSYRNNAPHALRERAMARAAVGRTRHARRLLDRSIALAHSQEASFEGAQSRAVRGRLGLALGWPGALADQHAGEQSMAALASRGSSFGASDLAYPVGAPVPGLAAGGADGERGPAFKEPAFKEQSSLARSDRFAALLNAGRTIAGATSAGAVRRAVQEAATVVLRGEGAVYFELRGSEAVPWGSTSGESLGVLSHSLIERAVTTAEVVTESPGLDGPASDSLVLSDVRSALCAPITRGGKVTAGFSVIRRHVAGVFSDEERRLAAFIAAVAGATLDHVAGSEAHFRALVRNSHDLTVVTDATGKALYVSPSITAMLGYRPTEFTRFDGHLVHADDRERAVNAFRLARFSPASRPVAELRARHRDGSWRWLEVTISNLLADTSIRGMVFNIRDITDRKSAEVALGQATEQFRLSFENAPIGMALTSIDPATEGWLLRVNQAMADMLGYSRPELEGRTIAQITHPDDIPADEVAMARFQANQATSFATEKRYRHADGHWIWVQLQVNMVAGDGGPRKYVISQMLDITERRAAEEQLTFLALHDPLTGLANRRLLLDRLSLAVARSARSGRLVGVLYLDLDRFKSINDSLGHDHGDHLLLQVASRLGELVRDTDTLARLGGDEFVLIADDLTGSAEALAIARRIEESFDQPFDLPGGLQVSVSASVGVALASDATDPKILLRHADAAMYQAKERGRSCHHLYCDDEA